MPVPLPADCLDFLRSGRTLSFDEAESAIGPISLVDVEDVAETSIRIYPGCQEFDIWEDLYLDLGGQYVVPAVNLIADSEYYEPNGLFCWISHFCAYGTVDPEHGIVRYYPEATWEEILADPLSFLDGQWSGAGVVARPWLHFPFCIYDPPWADEPKTTLSPYPPICPVHSQPVTAMKVSRPKHFHTMRQRTQDEWLNEYRSSFPCSGLATDAQHLLCCAACRAAEDRWVQAKFNAIPAVEVRGPASAKPDHSAAAVTEVRVNSVGFVKCPGCGIRFSIHDEDRFQDGMHTSCGQRIVIVD